MLGYDPIVTASAAKQIAEHIRTAILEGKLKEEERLPTEDELAVQFGVSRPTIREALKRLAAQKLISSRRGPAGGTFVSRLRLEDLSENVTSSATMLVSVGALEMDEIAEARIELEGICCRLAIAHWSETAAKQLQDIVDRQREPAISDQDFCALDVRFHRLIVDATSNTMLRFVMYAVIEALVPITNMVIVSVRERRAILGFHDRMSKAFRSADPIAMQDELRGLISYLMESYAQALRSKKERQAVRDTRSLEVKNGRKKLRTQARRD